MFFVSSTAPLELDTHGKKQILEENDETFMLQPDASPPSQTWVNYSQIHYFVGLLDFKSIAKKQNLS